MLAGKKKLIYITLALLKRPNKGGVAQMVRVSACHAEGRGFESRHSRHGLINYK